MEYEENKLDANNRGGKNIKVNSGSQLCLYTLSSIITISKEIIIILNPTIS